MERYVSPVMAIVLSPSLVRKWFLVFVLVSLLGFGAVFVYGNDLPAFVAAASQLQWRWMLVGVGLAALDWIGGGLRLWVLVRHVHSPVSMKGMILAGGMGAWAGYLTPLSSGSGPMMIYTMRRYGVPLPDAVTTTLMSFIATVIFFALAGPLAIILGGGRSLERYGNFLGLSLYQLFLGSLGIFAGLGLVMVLVIIFPHLIRESLHGLAERVGRRSKRVGERLEALRAGIDRAHQSFVSFSSPQGWLSLAWATLLSGPSHANKLLAGYVALRAVGGLHANFVDVLLLQTLITFLLYFAPTPGASGLAEMLSAAVMSSVYLPPALTPLYTLVWRCILSYFTLAFGFVVFSRWVRQGLRGITAGSDEMPAVGAG
jgi:uncharacterized protein (TIRG00374 family)